MAISQATTIVHNSHHSSTSRPANFNCRSNQTNAPMPQSPLPQMHCGFTPFTFLNVFMLRLTDNSPDKQLMGSSGYKWAKMCIAISKQFKEFGTSWGLENKLSSLGDTCYCPKGRQF